MTIVSSKGQIGFEGAWLVIVLLIIGLGIIFGLQAFQELNDDIQADLDLSPEAKQAAAETAGNSPVLMDNVFFFLFIGLWSVILILAYFSAQNPIFTILAIILGIMGLVVTMFVANIYDDATSGDDLQEYMANYPKTNWIMDNLLITMIFVTFSTMMVLYVRNSG